MDNFAVYRLPHADHCTLVRQIHGDASVLDSISRAEDMEGFVFAPFQPTADCPLLMLRPDVVEEMPVDYACEVIDHLAACRKLPDDATAESFGKDSYLADFRKYHTQLTRNAFRKLVLARQKMVPDTRNIPLSNLFAKACHNYPRMFVALVSTPLSGTWLIATPEILLDGDGTRWCTMALAGTMKLSAEEMNTEGERVAWSPKNIQEQRLVASYIAKCLEKSGIAYSEEGPYTTRAADLVHLRSDFTFTMEDKAMVGPLVASLHPTPAVCGLPKQEAWRYIVANEHNCRRYYSGFAGPLSLQGHTHLYVSLRCMEIEAGRFRLYAGGGLLRESNEDSEWQETENKMHTMLSLITGGRSQNVNDE